MVNSKNKKRLKLTTLVFLGIFIINYESIPLVSSNSHYTFSFEKGSQIFEVIYYDEEAWKLNINVSSNPIDWFGGDSDTIGAKSKTTILGLGSGDSGTLGMFNWLFYSWFDVNSSILRENGYGQSYIDYNYPNSYDLWSPVLTFWPFGTEPFDNYSNSIIPSRPPFLFQETLDFQSSLYNYNDFAAVVNNDTALQAINFSMPIFSGDDFLWHYILHRYVMVSPINNYLTGVIDALECENVSVQENKVTFMRYGEKAYIMDFTYNSRGFLDTVVVKDNNNNLIYKITSSNLKFVVYIIIGISLSAILGLIGFSFYRKRRLKIDSINYKK